jgi:hypothetical protein
MNAGQSRCVIRSVITARVGSSPVHAQQDTYTTSSWCLVPDSACICSLGTAGRLVIAIV